MVSAISPAANDSEMNLLNYWHILRKYHKSILVIVAVASISAVITSLVLPWTYRAEAVIMPISAKSGGALPGLSSEFAGLASLAGVVSFQTSKSSKFMAILKSRTLTEIIIKRENLKPILFRKKWDAEKETWKSSDSEGVPTMEMAVNEMGDKHMSFKDDKKMNTITIFGIFRDPNVASRVVNAYLVELQKFINTNAFTMAKRNRIFIEERLARNKEDILKAGKEINEFYKTNHVSNVDAKVDVKIGVLEATDVRSPNEMMGDVYAELNVAPLANVQSDIDTVVAQKKDLERKLRSDKAVQDVPQQVYLTYLMLQRQLLTKINALLTTQYEMAKIEEAKEDLAFQVIDKAVPPIGRYSPKRSVICLTVFTAALLFSIFLAFFREYVARMKELED